MFGKSQTSAKMNMCGILQANLNVHKQSKHAAIKSDCDQGVESNTKRQSEVAQTIDT